ncbi:hypothetical protein L3Q82_022634 [Scortum barcoo]|uniref:Uncharacterized protein n=1 Tax=Scortum barcoo TaxID=214431 RepID=A0ACB8X2B1_9TELE|nr:hypothetical protein L3Q82_022634 [Scortum barcoo]
MTRRGGAAGGERRAWRVRSLLLAAELLLRVEEVGLAVGEVVGHGSVKSAARMNSAVVLFLDQVEKANRVIETAFCWLSPHIMVNGDFSTLSLQRGGGRAGCRRGGRPRQREVGRSDEQCRGPVPGPGGEGEPGHRDRSCRAVNPLLRRVVSHRRQLYMILKNRDEELNLRLHVRVEDFDYVIFATSAAMKCFGCGKEGHTVRACPDRGEPAPPGVGGASGAVDRPGAADHRGAGERSGVTSWPGQSGVREQVELNGSAVDNNAQTGAEEKSNSEKIQKENTVKNDVSEQVQVKQTGEVCETRGGGTGEVGDVQVSETGKVSGVQVSETGEVSGVQVSETGEVSGVQVSETGEMQKTWCEEVEEAEMVEQEAAWKPTPRKRRTKVRNVCGEAKTSRVSTDGQAASMKEEDELFEGFCSELPQVSEWTNSQLEKPLKMQELQAALQNMQGRKSPRALMASLLNYKLLSKALANRLKEAIEQVIHMDQTYCVPGRGATESRVPLSSLLSVTRTVKKWSEEAEEALKDCFNTTLWDVFSDTHGEDIDSLTHCLTDYINFCVEITISHQDCRELLQQQALDYPGH